MEGRGRYHAGCCVKQALTLLARRAMYTPRCNSSVSRNRLKFPLAWKGEGDSLRGCCGCRLPKNNARAHACFSGCPLRFLLIFRAGNQSGKPLRALYVRKRCCENNFRKKKLRAFFRKIFCESISSQNALRKNTRRSFLRTLFSQNILREAENRCENGKSGEPLKKRATAERAEDRYGKAEDR